MDRRMREALDRHITGNYGEDQFKHDDEQLIREVMESEPEASAGKCLPCVRFDYEKCVFVFLDEEASDDQKGKYYTVTMEMLKRGLPVLVELVLTGKFKSPGFAPYDAGTYDGESTDALVQCAIFGKVIYG